MSDPLEAARMRTIPTRVLVHVPPPDRVRLYGAYANHVAAPAEKKFRRSIFQGTSPTDCAGSSTASMSPTRAVQYRALCSRVFTVSHPPSEKAEGEETFARSRLARGAFLGSVAAFLTRPVQWDEGLHPLASDGDVRMPPDSSPDCFERKVRRWIN